MHCIIHAISLLLALVHAQNVTTSKKRGLIYIWSEDSSDDDIWNAEDSPLTWYYNYGAYPTYGIDQDKLQFVPMMWGTREEDFGFYDTVKGLLDDGVNIEYVLGFNEPDGCEGGGSCVDAGAAAKAWKEEIEPLKKHGVKLGAPAVRGGGSAWLDEFYSRCDGGCTTDFMPAHWYGDSVGIAGWVGALRDIYPDLPVWLTEFAYPDGPLDATQQTFLDSLAYLDGESYITHYSYFSSFRSDEANSFVGPNVSMLNRGGKLRDIGAWYLGRRATGIGPLTGVATAVLPCWWHAFIILVSCLLVVGRG